MLKDSLQNIYLHHTDPMFEIPNEPADGAEAAAPGGDGVRRTPEPDWTCLSRRTGSRW